MSSPLDRDLAVLHGMLERGETSAVHLIEEAVERHASLGRELRAYKCFDSDGARARSAALESDTAGPATSPFFGLPISVKDLYGVEGLPTFAGTARRLPSRWEREGFLVRACRSAGGVLVGKTHTVELAFGGVGTNPHWGSPVNPWDRAQERIAGGSSCGAGVSLAEGSAVIALGTDTGGSIRIPAALTGVVGHKLTRGRWSTDGVFPLSGTLDTVGALTRSVRDQIYFFATVDPYCGGPAEAERDLARSEGVRGLRIGVPASALWSEAEPGVAQGVRSALAELERAGARLVELDGRPFDEASSAYLESGLVAVECAAGIDDHIPEWWPLLHESVGTRISPGRSVLATHYVSESNRRLRHAEAAQAWLADVDVAAVPTVPIAPPPQGEVADLDRYVVVNRACLRATTPISYLDLCALSLPAGLDATGLPVGLQLFARGGADLELLAAAWAVERVLGTPAQRLGRPARLS